MKIGITGCLGRMGQMLVHEIIHGNHEAIELAGGSVLTEDEKKDVEFFATEKADELFKASDVIIDFTQPEATENHIALAVQSKIPLVIGTTGLSAAQEEAIAKASQTCPIVYAANMSLGVNLMLALVEKAAKSLDDSWDIEIHETHHHHKIDSPSGTALALGKAAALGRNVSLDNKKSIERSGARQPGDIGFSVQRGGDVAGEHTVSFFGQSERIALTHLANDRAIFARGALHAAQWLHQKAPGLYSMRDVLGL